MEGAEASLTETFLILQQLCSDTVALFRFPRVSLFSDFSMRAKVVVMALFSRATVLGFDQTLNTCAQF